jgi:hypothetical protein
MTEFVALFEPRDHLPRSGRRSWSACPDGTCFCAEVFEQLTIAETGTSEGVTGARPAETGKVVPFAGEERDNRSRRGLGE